MPYPFIITTARTNPLVEGVGAGSPPREEYRQADGLQDLGGSTDANGVERPLLSEDLSEDSGSGGGREDQTAEVGCALVAQSGSGVDESADTVSLEGRADEGGAPGDGSRAGLLGADELLLGVRGLSALVGLAEERRQHGQLDAVVEEGAKGNSRGLHRREV